MSEAERFSTLLERKLGSFCHLPSGGVARLYEHYELLKRWNAVLNLTRIEELEEVVERHYCESLFLAAHLGSGPASVMDVGSGAGFPGIPVAVSLPDWPVTLAESNRRKAVFLREATREYSNVKVEAARADGVKGDFDWVVTRAVRWGEVLPLVRRSVALLLGDRDAVAAALEPGYAWEPAIELPWGESSRMLIGHRRST